MSHGFMQRVLSCFLVLCLLAIGGVASAQSLTHDTQHSHHQKATHSTVLCSWMCAAGQVLDSHVESYFIERTPVTFVERAPYLFLPRTAPDGLISRGPPAL